MAGAVPDIITPIEDRVWPKILVVDGHWLFMGSLNLKGYGQIWCKDERRPKLVHRVVWEAVVGKIPDLHVLDHLCRQHACCFPGHLEPVPNKTNVRRGLAQFPPVARHLEHLIPVPTDLPIAA